MRWLVALCCAGVAAGGSYVYTASNTVPTSYAGIGNNVVNGYTVSNLVYTLNAANPRNVDSVSFTLTTAGSVVPSAVSVQLASAGTWYSCTASLTPTCTTTGATAAGATNFTAVAVK